MLWILRALDRWLTGDGPGDGPQLPWPYPERY